MTNTSSMGIGVAGRQVRRWAPISAVSMAFVTVLWWTWGTWPDVLVDSGRELYAAWKIGDGQALYREIAWLNGPLSPYVNALWFQLFGVGLRSLVIGNICLSTLLLWALFKVFTAIGSRFSATVSCLTFVALFACGQLTDIGNFNFISPYSHDLTHGVILSFAGLACFASLLRSGSVLAAAGAGAALGFVFLTKAEVFAAAAAALLIGLALAAWLGAIPRARLMRVLLCFGAALLLPVVGAFGFFARDQSAATALLDAMGAWRHIGADGLWTQVFYRRIAGLIDPWVSIRAILSSAAVYVVVFGAAAVGAFIAQRRMRDRVLASGLAFGGGVVSWSLSAGAIRWDQAARPLPLLLLCAIVIGLRQLLDRARSAEDTAKHIFQVTVVTFAFVLLGRMLLNTTLYRYGFALAMPAMLVLVVATLDWIPDRLAKLGADANAFRAFSLAAWCVLVAVHLVAVSSRLHEKREWVSTGVDAFLADSRAVVVNSAVADIAARIKPSQTLVVLPEGAMLNYLTRRANPTPFVNFMPPEFVAFGEDAIIAALAEHPPDYVALVHKDTSEYGVHFFGRDYGERLLAWVEARYQAVQRFGAVPLQSDQFGITLLARTDRRQR